MKKKELVENDFLYDLFVIERCEKGMKIRLIGFNTVSRNLLTRS